MANRKISDLTALTAPVTGDLLQIVDISEAAAADKNKKITYGTFLSSVPLGTAAAPSIAFTGDINTGIYSPGADQLAIATGGTEKLIVTSTGLGVGTSSPANRITAAGAEVSVGIYNTSTGSTGSPSFCKLNFYGYLEDATGNVASISAGNSANNNYGGNLRFATNTEGGTHTTALTIDNQQRVGIGTTSPGGTVDIKAAASTAPLIVQGPSTEFARIDSSGRLLVGGSPDSGGALLQVFGDRIRVGTAKTPASASATGTAGEICWDASYIYVCTATNTWKRTAIATW